ncbi:TIGR-Tas system RNA-guided endonuclease [Acidiphilium angustum]|uniref:hypothetical protein n=1 Tax=Acidiphilium angustum TaxID=523 RepID=UPI000494BE9F|nr:hypothetical protein [Acidiphilium angustum]
MQPDRGQLRALVRGAYDLQKLRIMMGARIFANFRAKLGLDSSQDQEEDADADVIINALKEEYKLLTEGISRSRRLPDPKTFKGNQIIATYAELVLVHNFLEMLKRETAMFRDFEAVLEEFPIYTTWLRDIRGVGPAMAGVILSEIDIGRSTYPSTIWKFSGLDVADDGRGRSKRKEHLVTRAYKDGDGNDAERQGITYNPWLKTKLLGVLGGSFMRTGSPYADVYYGYKNRITQREAGNAEWSKGRIHRAAIRYMVKIFLLDLHKEWRKIEGLPVSVSYHEGKLGHVHHTDRKAA